MFPCVPDTDTWDNVNTVRLVYGTEQVNTVFLSGNIDILTANLIIKKLTGPTGRTLPLAQNIVSASRAQRGLS